MKRDGLAEDLPLATKIMPQIAHRTELYSNLLYASPKVAGPTIRRRASSPVYALFRSMLHETSARNEGSVFIDDAIRKRLLTGVFDAYYAETTPETVIFDTNRGWTTKLPALVELFADAKVICCVRNPAWVLDSVESLIRRNAFELSGIFSYDSGGTVYSRDRGSRVGCRNVRFRL